jgi:predicted MFS family arabinose efflux permease
MVPHMIYLSDLAVRGRELTSSAGAGLWLLFGCGAVVGTWTGGRSADRWGGRLTIHVWLTLQMIALCLVFLPFRATLPVAAVLGGLSGIGLTAVALVRAREVAGGDASALWARATSVYAVAQALAALGLAWLFPIGGHDAVFGVGLAFSLAALATSAIHRKQAS